MKVALAVSAFADSEPASSMRNSDQGPTRSSTEGCPVSLLTEIAVRVDGPGHCTVVGASLCGGGGGGGGAAPNSGGAAAAPGVTGLLMTCLLYTSRCV